MAGIHWLGVAAGALVVGFSVAHIAAPIADAPRPDSASAMVATAPAVRGGVAPQVGDANPEAAPRAGNLAAREPTVDAAAPGAERRDRWAARMARIASRAHDELRISEPDVVELRALQTDLREFKKRVRDDFASGQITKQQGDILVQRRASRFRTDVTRLLGADRAPRYFALVADVRAGDRGAP